MKVNIEELNAIFKRLDDINKVDLADIEWFENGERMEFSKKTIDDFKFVGLTNTYFIEMQVFKDVLDIPKEKIND